MVRDQSAKRPEIVQIRPAAGLASEAHQTNSNVGSQLLGGAEIPIQSNDDMASIGENAIGKIHSSSLRAAHAKTGEHVKNRRRFGLAYHRLEACARVCGP